MCTLIALHRCYPEVRLLIAANRDEFLDRPAAPPALRPVEGRRRAVSPRDLRAGGTWWGLNDAGLFAALTNRPSQALDASRRSRGLLVDDALAAGSARQAADAAERLAAGAYNPFNLFLSDGDRAFVVVYEGAPRCLELGPGAHVVGNHDPDSRDHAKGARLLRQAQAVAAGPREQALERLAEICREHDTGAGPLGDTCIHRDDYGTRSSTLLQRGPRPESDTLRFAAGPPCETPYDDLTPLLRELDRQAGFPQEPSQRSVA